MALHKYTGQIRCPGIYIVLAGTDGKEKRAKFALAPLAMFRL